MFRGICFLFGGTLYDEVGRKRVLRRRDEWECSDLEICDMFLEPKNMLRLKNSKCAQLFAPLSQRLDSPTTSPEAPHLPPQLFTAAPLFFQTLRHSLRTSPTTPSPPVSTVHPPS